MFKILKAHKIEKKCDTSHITINHVFPIKNEVMTHQLTVTRSLRGNSEKEAALGELKQASKK
jgi:hypothetical protein